ncbi:hypothetical protein NDU88_004914 [Pleurodeles waltl]|uniref:Uncharacterized protein n=1 Tax=Pleurodeles waltl TaxID=8319 RepID=A0AAV7WZ80_PLEWA|nr:hypothetical protein NDU88_004914 [Pleurodeles waltl]
MASPELTLNEVNKENLELFTLCLAEYLSGQYLVETFSTLGSGIRKALLKPAKLTVDTPRWFNADCSAINRDLRHALGANPRDSVLVVIQHKQYKEITRKCQYEFVSAQLVVLAQAAMQGNGAMFWAAVADVKHANDMTSAISCYIVASASEVRFSIIYAAPLSFD